MSNGERNYDYRQGYAKGYNYGFWAGAFTSFIGTVGLLYLIGIYG